MLKARILRPGFFTDEKVTQLSPWARLLFEGLWCAADDEGRLQWAPMQLKFLIFPAEQPGARGWPQRGIDELVEELVAHEMIILYEAIGKRWCAIPKFSDHQKLDARRRSMFPPPPGYTPPPRYQVDPPPRPAEAPAQPEQSGEAPDDPAAPECESAQTGADRRRSARTGANRRAAPKSGANLTYPNQNQNQNLTRTEPNPPPVGGDNARVRARRAGADAPARQRPQPLGLDESLRPRAEAISAALAGIGEGITDEIWEAAPDKSRAALLLWLEANQTNARELLAGELSRTVSRETLEALERDFAGAKDIWPWAFPKAAPAPVATAGDDRPTLSQVQEYAARITGGTPESAERFYLYYTARGWRLSRKDTVRDWKAWYRTWVLDGGVKRAAIAEPAEAQAAAG